MFPRRGYRTRVSVAHASGDSGRLKRFFTKNSQESPAVGENSWPHLHARWKAECLNFPVYLYPVVGSFSDGPHEGRGFDPWAEGAGNRSPVWSDRRDIQPSGMDLGAPGILAWQKARRRVETERWVWISGRYLQGMRLCRVLFHLANCICRP
jgi:hypothetical protein